MRPAGHALIDLSSVGFSYAGLQVLRDVSFRARAAEITALVGPNGAGKSTAFRLIVGQLTPEEGTIRVDGAEVAGRRTPPRSIGFVPQGIALVERLSLIENLRLFAAVSGVRRAERPLRVAEALDAVGLDERGRELVSRLSGGQRRLANVAAALVHRPKVLMLDEPTAGIDAVARERLYALLRRWRQNGMAILITTHDLGEADQLADSVAVMIDGTVVAAGSYGSVVQRLFDGRFECTVHLTPMAASSTGAEQDAIACELTSLGLSQRAEQPQTWSGLVELAGSFELRLLALLARTDRAIVEYHVRRPGLDAVVAHLRDRSDTTSHLLGSTCDSRSYAP